MAKKRLNKKVALIGSLVLLLFVLMAILVFLRLSRDPDKFIKDGDAAWKVKDYKNAERHYRSAIGLAKSGSLRKELLSKLEDIYVETSQWPKLRSCWEQIINIDPANIEARLGRLKYIYIIADNLAKTGRNSSAVWEDVQSQASELIKLVEGADLLMADRAESEPSFGIEEKQLSGISGVMGPYLYLLRARAAFALAQMGAVTDPEELLAKATEDLETVQKLEPNNVDAYWYLAQAVVEKGEILASRGNLEEREKAAGKADEILQQAVKAADDVPRAHINLLKRKLLIARRSEPKLVKQQIKLLEPEYQLLVNKFPSSGEAFASLSGFYSIYWSYSDRHLLLDYFERAVKAAEKAAELDNENVEYAINAANLYYRKFSVYGQEPGIHKAIALAKNALELPDTQDTTGPRSLANETNRFLLSSFLANCYIEQILSSSDQTPQSQIQDWLKNAEQLVHDIEQISGSGEEPQVIKWQGMLELSKGNTDLAVRKLYAAYEQIKTSYPPEQRDPHLSYTLAKIFEDTSEVGAVMEFLVSALESGIELIKPEAILDYLEVSGKRDMWSHILSPANPVNIDAYEQKFGSSQRTQAIRVKALIGTNQVSKAEDELAKLDQNNPDAIKIKLALVEAKIRQIKRAIVKKQTAEDPNLVYQTSESGEIEDSLSDATIDLMKVELNNYSRQGAELLQRLLMIKPDAVEEYDVIGVCRSCIEQDQIAKAKDTVNQFLQHYPDNVKVLFYKHLLSEPNPKNVSLQKRKEIEMQVLSNISDAPNRTVQLGIFYRGSGELEKATEKFTEAMKMKTTHESKMERPAYKLITKESPRHLAANHLFDIACYNKDWKQAEQIVEIAQNENLDNCQGQLFAARLDAAKEQFNDALLKINECLKQKPIFSYAYMFRSNINAFLGNEHESIEDIRKAAYLNPLDGVIAKKMAATLFMRNRKLEDNVTTEQVIETRRALERAIKLNPSDLALLSDYAEYISFTEPSRALAIRQALQKNAPSLQNAILLSRLASSIALKETDMERKEVFFEIAQSSLEEAKKIDPDNRMLLQSYAEYYRARGQNEKAQQLLLQSKDDTLLWRHYFQLGRFEDAREVLQRLYKQQAKDSDVIRGLLFVAEKTADREAIQRYSEELLSLEDNVENRLDQINAFLLVGLTEEAKYKLQSFKEKYPDESRILLFEAWLAMRQGQLEKALELINRNLEANQDHPGAWRLRGQINLMMSNYDPAINDLKKSKSLSDTPATRIALAKAYLHVGREDDAIIELKNTIEATGVPMEARVLLEQIYLKLDRKETLRRFYDDTLQTFPDSVPWYIRAATFAMSIRDFSKAEQFYKKAYDLKQQEYLGQNSENAMQDAQYAAAFDGYLQALVLGAGEPNGVWRPQKLNELLQEGEKHQDTAFAPLAFCRMVEAKLKLGDRNTALQYCQKAIEKAEINNRLTAEVLMRMFLAIGSDDVSSFCEQKLSANPDSIHANFTMFNLANIKGEYDRAIDYISKCIELTGPDTPSGLEYKNRKADFLIIAYGKTSDNKYLKEAIIDYESLLSKMPNNNSILNNLAYLLAEQNQRLSDALKYAKKALELMPNNPSFMDTYGYVLYKNGQAHKAAQILTAAMQQYQQDAIDVPSEIWEHLGMVKEELGEKDSALVDYKQALQAGAESLPEVTIQRIKSAIERLSQ